MGFSIGRGRNPLQLIFCWACRRSRCLSRPCLRSFIYYSYTIFHNNCHMTYSTYLDKYEDNYPYMGMMIYPCASWCWNIYIYLSHFYGPNVGKYTRHGVFSGAYGIGKNGGVHKWCVPQNRWFLMEPSINGWLWVPLFSETSKWWFGDSLLTQTHPW